MTDGWMDGQVFKRAHLALLMSGSYDFTIGLSVVSHHLRSRSFTVIVLDVPRFFTEEEEKNIQAGFILRLAERTPDNMSICF